MAVIGTWHRIRFVRLRVKSWKILFLLGLLVAASFAGALLFEMNRAEQEVRNYLGSWEEDVAKALLVQKDVSLLNKILGHVLLDGLSLSRLDAAELQELPGAEQTRAYLKASATCLRRFEIPVTLYGLPATRLELCESPAGFFVKGLLSPLFLGALLIGAFLIWLFRRESGRWLRERTRLQSRVVLQEDLARVSRQVAHDIRSPLSALQIALSVSENVDAAEERNRILLTAVDRIRGISEDLHSHGKMSLDGSTSFAGIERAFERLRGEMAAQFPGRELTWNGPAAEALELPLRPEVWERILQNLLRNSCEAVQTAHEKRVAVRAEAGANGLLLAVWDSGEGIPAHLIERVGFEGFLSQKEGGTGLGLAFVRRHVESVGGAIEFARPWGGGFEVRITCPILRFESPARSPGTA